MKYYDAYDQRYRVIHEKSLTWFPEEPTPEVRDWMTYHGVSNQNVIGEVGCGEGRDAISLALEGYRVIGMDISHAAIDKCIELAQLKNIRSIEWYRFDSTIFQERLYEHFDFLYSIGTLHMLVDPGDREAFLKNMYDMLKPNGKVLLVNKGNGQTEYSTGSGSAFELDERTHHSTGETYKVAATSYRSITWEQHVRELRKVGFNVVKQLNTSNSIYEECMTVYLGK